MRELIDRLETQIINNEGKFAQYENVSVLFKNVEDGFSVFCVLFNVTLNTFLLALNERRKDGIF